MPARPRHQFVVGGAADGYRPFTDAVRPYLGTRPALALPGDDRVATTDGTTFEALGSLALSVAESRGIGRGDRVRIDATSTEETVLWLLAPLLGGASLELCAGAQTGGARP